MLPLFPSPSFSVISQLEDNFKSVDQITRLLLLNFLMASLCTENKTHICFYVADNGSLGYNSPCNFSSLPRLFQSASTKPFLHHAVPCARNALSTFFYPAHTSPEVIAPVPTPWKDFFCLKRVPSHTISFTPFLLFPPWHLILFKA